MTALPPNGRLTTIAPRPLSLGVLVSYLRAEEKAILAAARDRLES